MIRNTVYAGTWYPSTKKEIEEFIVKSAKKQKAKAVFCPHAGWAYSGKIAGEVFSSIEPAKLYIIIGPNHHGTGAPVGVWNSGAWHTPLGPLEIDEVTAESIIRLSGFAREDTLSHAREHSIEVQLPFIKYFNRDAMIVPISLSDYSPKTCKRLGEAIAETVKERNLSDSTVLVASTDMSHYVSAAYAEKADSLAIDRILELDPAGLIKTVEEHKISMCGSGPAAAVLWGAKGLGASKAKLIRYTTSGEVSGDNNEVVGYAGIVVY